MGNSTIDNLKKTLGMGARSNKYRVIIFDKGNEETLEPRIGDLLCKTTTLPGRSFADIEVWNQGRLTVIAGPASFEGTWNVTFMDTENHSLRGRFLNWMEFIDSVANHKKESSNHDSYMSSAILQQLSTVDNSVTAEYLFNDVYPKSISESTYSDESEDLLEFSVEFNYTSFEKMKDDEDEE